MVEFKYVNEWPFLCILTIWLQNHNLNFKNIENHPISISHSRGKMSYWTDLLGLSDIKKAAHNTGDLQRDKNKAKMPAIALFTFVCDIKRSFWSIYVLQYLL